MATVLAKLKHPFCSVSHWLGALLALAGSVVLLAMANGRPLAIVAFAVYGLSLTFLYSASGLYHSVNGDDDVERKLRNFDHIGIFLLISGTYVPVCLLALPPPIGITMLVLEAVLALIGIVGTLVLKRFPNRLNLTLYLLMGWMAVPATGYMSSHWPGYATGWLLAGGLTYTVGAVIFALDKPHLIPGRFSAHDLWHIFVLGGSACHFALMYTYVARLP